MAKEKSIGAEMVARRYAKMTPEARSAAAKHAAEKRWEGVKKKRKKKAGKASAAKRWGTPGADAPSESND